MANTDPLAIAAGPDGNVWFTGDTGNVIGCITPDGAVTLFPSATASSGPTSITAGPDGNIWFVEESANQIGRFSL